MSRLVGEFLSAAIDMPLFGWVVFFAMLILLVVAFQVYLIQKQQAVLHQQLLVLRDVHRLSSQRADLQLLCDADFDQAEIRVRVENLGQKAASDFYWHLEVPLRLCRGLMHRESEPYPSTLEPMDGEQYFHVGSHVREPVYPSCARELGVIPLADPAPMPGVYRIRWSLASEGGPSGGAQDGVIEISVPPVSAQSASNPIISILRSDPMS